MLCQSFKLYEVILIYWITSAVRYFTSICDVWTGLVASRHMTRWGLALIDELNVRIGSGSPEELFLIKLRLSVRSLRGASSYPSEDQRLVL